MRIPKLGIRVPKPRIKRPSLPRIGKMPRVKIPGLHGLKGFNFHSKGRS